MNKPLFTTIVFFLIIALGGACTLPNIEFITPTSPRPAPPAVNATPAPTAPPDHAVTLVPAAPAPAPLAGLPSIVEVAEKTKPSVVAVSVESVGLNIFLQPVPQRGAGTGVIIDPKGYIVTNNHVVEDASTIKVALSDGQTVEAKVVGRDPNTDLAVIKIDPTERLQAAEIGDATRLRVGDWVVAIGNALALEGGPTVTVGVVSYIGRSIQTQTGDILNDLIQTDAAINPGNSGGPLVNLAGQVVGINTAIVGGAQNIGFSISMATALPLIQELINEGRVIRPWLGVELLTVTRSIAAQNNLSVQEGVLLVRIIPGSPADRAGLRSGDVVSAMAGKTVKNANELRRAIQSQKVGSTVEMTYIRGRQGPRAVNVNLVASPPPG
ncbi:MAG: trypsin-like peptidase domain-containing protein [Chloroflexi bacterium]|nr:trypsin-like peptidase domain-containing protein [Chloroflexota bacterium]